MTDRAKTLDLIQKLMRLAVNNPNEHESLRAALQAVKLIVEHKFDVGDLAPQVPAHPFQQPFYPPSPHSSFEEQMRRAQYAVLWEELKRSQGR